MLTYAIIVFVFGCMAAMDRDRDSDSDLARLIFMLPIFGRIFGWW